MRCDDVELEISARLDDATDPLLDDALDAHVATCPNCRRFRERALQLREVIRGEEQPPVPALIGPIMLAVGTRRRRLARIRSRTVLVGIASAAALLLVVVAISVMRTPSAERRTEAIRILRTRTLLVWTPDHVAEAFAGAIERLDGVDSVARVRSGVVWLDAWTDSSGREHRAPAGMRVPVELAAIDPQSYARFVPPPDLGILRRLGDGNVVLGDAGAALRGITASGSLRAGDTTLAAAGVVDDALIAAHEGVVSLDTARTIGITRVRYLLVEPADDVRPEDVVARIRGAVTGDQQVRVRVLGETPYLRHGDVVLPQVRMKQLFGEFAAADTPDGNLRVDQRWTKRNIVTVSVPVLGSVRCHRLVIPQLRGAMDELERTGLAALIRPDDYGGCFFPRYLSQDAGAGISHHSWGVAFDVNVGANAFGKPPQLDRRVVDVLERWGFTWGGRWLVPDGMHFEVRRLTAGSR